MGKKIRRIIALTLCVNVINITASLTNQSLMNTKVYAETDDGIQSIRIRTTGGGAVKIYSKNDYASEHSVDNTDIKHGPTYYAKTSSRSIKIAVDGVDDDHVRVFSDASDSTRGSRPGESFKISDTSTVIVRVYSQNPGVVKYSNDEYVSQYKIKVRYTGDDKDDEETNDNIYLKNITLSSGNINFSKYTYNYDVSVGEEINKLTIAGIPDADSDEYYKYKVKINGSSTDKDDKFKDTVDLKEGKNTIEVRVTDDDNERAYILNVTRGNFIASNSEIDAVGNGNWFRQANGKMQYKDEDGNIAKNKWIQNYYVQDNGDMTTDWLKIDGAWYYFGVDGIKKTGWQKINQIWYYLDLQGKMKTGWIQDAYGKYYYLNTDGSMAYNMIVDGFEVGRDGTWTGR